MTSERVDWDRAGFYLTHDHRIPAEAIRLNKVFIGPFSTSPDGDHPSGMKGLYGAPTSEGMIELGRVKGRDNRPFVDSTDPIGMKALIFANPNIHPSMKSDVLECLYRFLSLASESYPIGVFVPASNDAISMGPYRTGKTNIGGETVNTYGMMICGPSKEMTNVLGFLGTPKRIVLATSLNYSHDPNTGGSGHNFTGEAVQDFRQRAPKDATIAVQMPEKFIAGSGVSTTVVYVNGSGEARLVREGSLSGEEVITHLEQADLDYKGRLQDAKRLSPYKYRHGTALRGVRIMREMMLIRKVRREGVVYIPHAK